MSNRHAAAEAHLRAADPVIARLIAERGPCALAPDPHLFRALVRAIVAQQISVKAAAGILRRLTALLPDEEITPEAVATLDVEALRSAGLSARKAEYVRELAERVVSRELDLDALAALPDEEVVGTLLPLRGIGRWTVEMLLIFALGRLDVLPVDDLGFRTAVKRAYELPELPGKEALHALAASWRPYASIATWYLWRSLENTPQPQ